MSPSEQKSVLVVEDDEVSANTLLKFLTKRGYLVEVETHGDRAVKRILAMQPDAVVLDCNLPGKDGLDVCREVRSGYLGPIIMFTSRDDDIDHVQGMDCGADDYMIKPVTPHVVLAHLVACMRRVGQAPGGSQDEYGFGRFFISRATRVVRLDDAEVPFSTAEFDLLWLLASRAGVVLSRDDINSDLRGLEHDGLNRSIDMRISRLRKALGDNAENPARIKTVRGKGYLFSRSDWN